MWIIFSALKRNPESTNIYYGCLLREEGNNLVDLGLESMNAPYLMFYATHMNWTTTTLQQNVRAWLAGRTLVNITSASSK